MKLTLHHFLSTDNLRLPALLYVPDKSTDTVALFLHGNGSSSVFYSSMTNPIAEELIKKGISYFPFNNRGALTRKSLKRVNLTDNTEERVEYGTHLELIKECIMDIEGAIDYLEKLGYKHFYLIGHSTGANKIAVYNYYKPQNRVEKYILLAGGDDTGLNCNELGESKYWKAVKRSQGEVEKRNGLKTVAKSIFPEPYSYQALFDTLDPDGDYNIFPYYEVIQDLRLGTKKLFREIQAIKKPSYVIYGEQDEYCYGNVDGCVKILKKYTEKQPNMNFEIIPNATHGFDDYEKELGALIANWLLK